MISTLTVHVEGSLLLGAGSVAGADETMIRDLVTGVPFIPASALKGAIRQQMERILDPAAANALLGSAGVRAGDPPVDESAVEAEGEEDTGAEPRSRQTRFAGGKTKVYFSDAVLRGSARKRFEDGHGYSLRTQVSIDRKSGRAAEHRLYDREVIAPFADDLVFHARVDTMDLVEDEKKLLAAAVRGVFALGAGRTAGLGKVRMQLAEGSVVEEEPVDDGSEISGNNPQSPEINEVLGTDLEVLLEAEDPVCVGAGRIRGQFRRSLDHLSASTLRGAVATAGLIARGQAGSDQRGDPEFRRLFFDETTCLRFADAWPVADFGAHPQPPPFTLRTCKAVGAKHGVVDHLLRAFVLQLLAEQGIAAAPDDVCPECGSRLVAMSRPLEAKEPKRRIITRLKMETASGRAEDGNLFSIELMERGTRFVTRLRGVSPEAKAFLQDVATQSMRVGHGRGQGYGRMRIRDVRATASNDLMHRLEAFDGEVKKLLQALTEVMGRNAAALETVHHYLAVTLLSDLEATPTDSKNGEQALLDALGLDEVEIVQGQVRVGQRGGWDTHQGCPRGLFPVLRGGSTLLLRTPRPLQDLKPHLEELEDRGAGRARHLGLGWLRFSDPIHTPGWRTP